MIKFAVTRPKQRVESIVHGINMLKWPQDKYLAHFDVKVDPKMTVVCSISSKFLILADFLQTQARVLPNPEIQFDRAKLNPGTQGRWDLRGKKFLLPNPEPLNSWGFIILGGCTSEQNVRNFANVFISTYVGHGGRVQNKTPLIYNQSRNEDIPTLVHNARRAVGDQVKAMPQILFYVLPGRDSFMYERLKKNSECRFAMMSQCKSFPKLVLRLLLTKNRPQCCSCQQGSATVLLQCLHEGQC